MDTYSPALRSAVADVLQSLEDFAADPLFAEKFKLVFGTEITPRRFRALTSPGNLPEVEILADGILDGAVGAFSAQTGNIYLSESVVNGDAGRLRAVLLEEIGHYLDLVVNAQDTTGDEGELFSALVRGVEIGSGELRRLQTEDDWAVITIDEQLVAVEQATTNLGLRQGYGYRDDSVTTSDSGDIWIFSTTGQGNSNHYVQVSSTATNVDLVLDLYNHSTGQLLVRADDYGSNYNLEGISLADLPAGTYSAVVYNYYGANIGWPGSAGYRLEINAPQSDLWPVPLELIISTTPGNSTQATQITSTNTLYIDGAWQNIGSGSTVSGFWSRLLLNGTQIASWNNLAFSAGDFDYFTDFALGPLAPGNYTLTLQVDSTNAVFESDESNNTYSRTFTVTAPSIPQDGYESNNTLATARNLGTLSGLSALQNLTIHSSTDTDFFRFTTAGTSTDEHYIAAFFNGAQGIIDLNFFDSAGNFLFYALGEGSGYNYVPLGGLPAGTYVVQLGSYAGQTSPGYLLEFNLPVAFTTTGDRLETSGNSNNFGTTPTSLGTVAGFKRENDLSIHTPTDQDWFSFTITGQTNNNHYIAIDFNNIQGNLDLALYDNQGRLITYEANNTDGEYISLWGLPQGTYRVAVYSWLGQTNEYDLIINAPGTTSGIQSDSFESNNTRSAAKALKNFGWSSESGYKEWNNLSIHTASDEDWFSFDLKQTGAEGHFVGIALDNIQGDLDIELYNSAGNKIGESKGTRNFESISLAGRGTGTYFVRVLGFNGAVNPNYSLVVNTPGDDIFEANNTRAVAKDLSNLRTSPLKTWQNLSITAGDNDWFKFNLPSRGTANDFVSVTFDHSLGDVDLELYNSSGTRILSSAGTSNSERISLEGQTSGDYFVRVLGYNNATNPNYDLTISAPLANGADSFESNNSFSTAYNLNNQIAPSQQGRQVVTLGTDPEEFLSIHNGSDVDWFKFTIAGAGQQGHYAAISFDHTLGDLDLQLYNSSNTLLKTSEGVANAHSVDLKGLSAGTYYLRVYGHNGEVNPSYTLTVDAPFAGVTADWGEGSDNNNAISRATNLGKLDRQFNRDNLSITANDTDWFRFEIDAKGGVSDAAGITFNHQQGDLDIELYASDGTTLLDSSQGVGNTESISFNGRNAGVYFLKVYGYNGATNSEYSVAISAPVNAAGDWADRLAANNTAATARDLRTVQGFQTWEPFSIHTATDVDWFRFTTLATASATDYLQIDFDHTLGDLELELYAANGTTLLGKSETTNNFERLNLVNTSNQPLGAGTYLVKVTGYNGAINPSYQLSVNAPDPSVSKADWAEANNTRATATDLQAIDGSRLFSGLSIHQGGDEDWFKFTTIGTGLAGQEVSIAFDHQLGNLQLQLYREGQSTPVLTSDTQGDRESVSLAGLAAGTYTVRVYGATSSVTNPGYSLSINAPQTPEADWLDKRSRPNNTLTLAYDLRNIDGSVALSGLSIHTATDQDWFKVQIKQRTAANQFVSIDFAHQEGDLWLELFNASGTKLRESNTDKNSEQVSLANLDPGAYYVKVSGAVNPNYSLTVQGIPDLVADALEGATNGPKDAYQLRDLAVSGGKTYYVGGRFAYGSYTRDNANGIANELNEISLSRNVTGVNPGGVETRYTAGLFNGTTIAPRTNLSNEDRIAEADRLIGSANLVNSQTRQSISGYANPWPSQPSQNFYQPSRPQQNYLTPQQLAQVLQLQSSLQQAQQQLNAIRQQQAQAQLQQQIALGQQRQQQQYQQVYQQQQPVYNGIVGGVDNILNLGGGNFANRFSSGFNKPGALSSPSNYIAYIPNLSINSATDQDWIQFDLSSRGEDGQFISLTFDHNLGDLQLELFEAFNTTANTTESQYRTFLVDRSNGQGNTELIDLAGLAKGNYLVRVSGVNGATNPNYILTFSGPPPLDTAGDWTEATTDNTHTKPYDLKTVEGVTSLSALSIHTASDRDWFQFKTTSVGKAGHNLRIDFNHALGDLDLVLYNQDGTTVRGRSETTENYEEISLDGLAAGTYKVQVLGYQNATNPNYTLTLSAPNGAQTPILSDYLETNNSAATATDLDRISNLRSIPGLTIHSGDNDWFKFTTTQTGTAANFLSVEFEHAQGDLQLELYRASNLTTPYTTANLSSATNNRETLSLAGEAAGTYYARVIGNSNATNNYQFYIDAPTNAASTKNEWTIFVYMTGSDLAESAFNDINEMELAAASLPSNVKIAVFWDQTANRPYATANQSAWGTAGWAILQPDTDLKRVATPFTLLGEKNSGDPATLTEFINLAKSAAPANNYGLILWNHGNGELGGFNVDNEGTSANTGADRLYSTELDTALQNVKNADPSFSLKLLAFDACLMAMAEVAYMVRNHAEIFVASQEAAEDTGYDYTTAFAALINNPGEVKAIDLANSLIASYQQQHQGDRRGWDTLSATSTSALNTLVTSIKTFTDAAVALTGNATWDAIKDARDFANSFYPAPYYRDLGQFLQAVATSTNSNLPANLKTAANNALTALRNLVVDKTADQRNVQGLSVYFPNSGAIDAGYLSRNSQFLNATGWTNFLNAFTTRGSSTRNPLLQDWAEGNDVAARAFNLNTLTGNGHRFTNLSLPNAADQDYYRFSLSQAGGTGNTLTVSFTPQTGQSLAVSLFDPDNRTTALKTATASNGQASFNLSGLVANKEYLLLVNSPTTTGQPIPNYTLAINAPGAVQNSNDWATGNNTAAKAANLGTIIQSNWFTGLQVDSTTPDWFKFNLPKVSQLVPLSVTVHIAGNATATAQLFDPSNLNTPLATQTGAGSLQLTTPTPEPGKVYQLRVSQPSGQLAIAYSIAIEPVLVALPTGTTLAISATNASQTEGNSGSKAFTFTVARSGAATGTHNVNWAVTGSGSNPANATDFVGSVLPSGTVSFAAGETSKVITVNVQGDTTVEPNENFTVTLSNATNGATITTATAIGTIQNDDTSVTPIEAFGNTKLVQDATNKLYAQIGNNNPIAIKNGATHIATNTYPGWQILAAET
ncbi:MAG: pre-peptidase C-terminal domain-containing protein, partial [Microcystis sp. M20BS1]|uniref:pre-peptidase C-terminal domain-containing protein n=1 Tax=unclassified Microcystis TaxID=2643300 RepID=UPI00257A36B6